MTSRDDMKTTGGGQAMLSADELRMMAAFERRSGHGAEGVDEPLDPELEAELADFLTISRRIAEVDREPVAASVRGVVMSEAAKVLAAHEEAQAPNGLIAMLMALLRPGPVLAVAAMVALAVAISVRTERPAAVAADASMVAMHDEGRTPAAAAAAAAANEAPNAESEKAADTPQDQGLAAAEARGGEGVGAAAQAAADEVARADEPAAVAPTGTLNAALERAREPRRALEDQLAKAEPEAPVRVPLARPKRAIAARPAAVDPAGTPPPSDDATDLAAAPARDNKLQAVEQKYAYDAAAKLEAKAVAAPAKPAARVAATRNADLVAPSAAPAAAPAPSAAADEVLAKKVVDAEDAKKKQVSADSDDRTQNARSDELAKLRGALAKASSTAERVRILERIVALLSADGETRALQQARKDLSKERAALAGDSGSAKAAPRQKARSAPTSMKR